MFHLIYTRSNTEYYKGDTFESNYTLYRNIPYSELSKFLEMQKDPELLKECDTKYFEHQEKNGITDTCFHSEISIVDDEEYFKTYKYVYRSSYNGPSGLIPEEEDYFMDYGQKSNFMLIHDYNPNYTWFGKDWTQEMINAEYEKRELDNQARV
jgi:hypothetical protein|tara:strand:+ start:1114 stop:1572 length:459 start_codon:yes stop_codon:yes gene_type:complete